MDDDELEPLFHSVEFDRGPRYVAARDALVRAGDRARPFLESHLHDPDRGRVQAAQVVLGWMDHAEEYRRCSDYLLRRELPPFDGTAAMYHVAETLRSMQPLIVPRLVELLIKTDEVPYRTYDQDQDAHQAWGELVRSLSFDRRYAEPLATIVFDERRPLDERLEWAHHLLREYGDTRVLELAHRLAWDRRVPMDHRSSAFDLLAQGERTGELPAIRASLERLSGSPPETLLLVRAAAGFDDPSFADLFLALLRRSRSTDTELRVELIHALGGWSDLRARPDIERLAAEDPEGAVGSAARDALIDLRMAQREAERRSRGEP
ncbi:MAG: hypothetical protein IT378_16690 [Sandaracinaceae bacterium]|nr:hypothetical protein [Sandaracinaceae bacterium]